MNRRSFPTGHASAALLKALMRSLAADEGQPAADAWLRGIRMTADDLDDETRLVPLPTLHRALAAFAEVSSRDAVPRLWRQLVAPDNLGVWVRVLRGTSTPSEAFERLGSSESEYGRTTRWETIEAGRGRWRGRVTLLHDPALEQDGLLRLARLAELRAVPALLGYPGVRARDAAGTNPSPAGIVEQVYEVSWREPSAPLQAAVGAAAGSAAGLAPLVLHLAPAGAGVSLVGAVAAAGALAGVIRGRELQRRAESHAQATRVQALERSLSLRDRRSQEVGAQLEGSVVAGQYRLARRMGSGATGVIYEAARISDGLPVAIKLLRAAAAHEAVASDRLRREAEALGLSWHPNVVEVIDHGHLPDGTAYLVMELLHGEPLAARLKSKGRLTPRELLPIAIQACDALAAVHAAGVVHRDLKPSNIYLAVDRDDPAGSERVKLLDFGIARVEWEETRITNTGGPLGTPGYMSPEQEMGSAEIDARSDLYALGAVLFECLVGEPPPPRSPSGLIRTGDAPDLRFDSGTQKAASAVPPGWRAIIEKAMQMNPADRYQDARAFAAALRAVREEIAATGASS